MVTYLVLGTLMFAAWEGWEYVDSIYFCVTSLLKIGFGDFVPGANNELIEDTPESQVNQGRGRTH